MQSENKRGAVVAPFHVWASPAELSAVQAPFNIKSTGEGRGAGAFHVTGAGLDCVSISVALGSREIPAGPLLRECQGLQVLALARAQAARLKRSMARDGRGMSDATESDALGAGAVAVVEWRNGVASDGSEFGARGVCWRAIVRAVATDSLGESIEDWRGADESGAECWDHLTGSALPLPPLLGDGSRAERATRLQFERARAKRPALLTRRVECLKARGGRGRRAESIDKLHRAAVLLLHGESLDRAASAAGFKGCGVGRQSVRTGDMLARAARRLGLPFRFTVRDGQRAACEHRGAFVPLSAVTAAGWSFQPSAKLPLQDGRGGKRRVAKLRRLQRARARCTQLARARAAWAARWARQACKRRGLARAARRADKAAGWWARYGASASAPRSRTNGFWRGGARKRAVQGWRVVHRAR